MRRAAFALPCLSAASAAAASDMLPLKRGIYVEVGVPCKGASNADTLSYWGNDNGINAAHASCRITALSNKGPRYELGRACRLIQGPYIGHRNDRLRLTIVSRTSFVAHWRGFQPVETTYRYCGPKVQF
jgi:hypothetical protein